MNLLATIRQRQTSWARRALGVFVVMWLNLALQPCAMALGSDHDGDCPKCPPAQAKQHDGHESAARDTVDQEMPCASDMGDCSILDELNYDGRNAQLKIKDGPQDLPVAILPIAEFALNIKTSRRADLRPIQGQPPGPPRDLNKLYCVCLQ